MNPIARSEGTGGAADSQRRAVSRSRGHGECASYGAAWRRVSKILKIERAALRHEQKRYDLLCRGARHWRAIHGAEPALAAPVVLLHLHGEWTYVARDRAESG